jgi:nitric oxide reductase subunit B
MMRREVAVFASESAELSPWWRRSVVITAVLCFAVLGWMARRTYLDAPPIPRLAVDPAGRTVFTGDEIRAGQSVFLQHGLMENGSILGHGAYLGPDFTAQYLHNLVGDMRNVEVGPPAVQAAGLGAPRRVPLEYGLIRRLKENRYDAASGTLRLTADEAASFQHQLNYWANYFIRPRNDGGLPARYITDPRQIRQLTAFFAWTAWVAVTDRPSKNYSYTNNFPYDPAAGNTPTSAAVLWSALSLVVLLTGLAAVLFAFGRFDFLGWHGRSDHVHPQILGIATTPSQRATLKYFLLVALMFFAQALAGGLTEHYRADPSSFYGFDLSRLLPSQILRTWHLQLAILWIATAYVAGGLFLAPALGKHEPRAQNLLTDLLFWALLLVIAGSLLGEWLGMRGMLGKLWPWFGDQGWEYLDLGRAWQVLLAAGLVLWVVLLYRAVRPALRLPAQREMATLFMCAAAAIPVFYLPAFFFNVSTNFTVVDLWRFWIIHLWVENFLELFVTVAVALIFYELRIVSRITAARTVYLDALLYLGGGIIGTGHHWYFTGQSEVTMALGASFSALEVVPLTLLTLDAWDFIRLTSGHCAICGSEIRVPHEWTFYFLMAVGFWNFVGAGIFGFLINLPIVSYFEVGTMLTPNHGHAAMMGVFGMLAVALMVFAFRQVMPDRAWPRIEKYVRVSFWGLNVGLALMVLLALFPGGVYQLHDSIRHGYWHARSVAFQLSGPMHWIEWLRLPADATFILLGAGPLVIAAFVTCCGAAKPVPESADPGSAV